MASETIALTKLEVAKRQLSTAISLWFQACDPVAAHTLAFAAYEIFHVISEKFNPYRRDLLFDTLLIRDEYRRDWNRSIKSAANFFKHADRDADSVIEFNPQQSEFLILFAIMGRELCGEAPSDEEAAFAWWLQIVKPDLLTENGRKNLARYIPTDGLEYLRTRPKKEFFEAFLHARRFAVRQQEGVRVGFPME